LEEILTKQNELVIGGRLQLGIRLLGWWNNRNKGR